MLAFFRNEMGFGGNNGLTDFKDILGFRSASRRHARRPVRRLGAGAWRSAIWPAASSSTRNSAAWWWRSAMPKAARASSATGSSSTSSGCSCSRPCWPASPARLYVPQVGIINPGEFSPLNSIEMVIWVAVGGRGTCTARWSARCWSTTPRPISPAALPEVWLFCSARLFVLVTMLLPRGVIGLLRRKQRGGRRMNVRAITRKLVQTGALEESARPAVAVFDPQSECHARPDPLSGGCHRQLRRLQGAQQPHPVHRRRRTALHHRRQRRRQDHA